MLKYSRLAINTIFFINGFLFANWASRIPDIQLYFDLSYQQLGSLLFISAIGSLVGMPLAGIIIPKHGSRLITLIAVCCYIVSIPLFMLSPNYSTLLLSFGFMGCSVGVLDVSMNDQAVVVEQGYHRPIMTFFHAMFSAGMMVGAGAGMLFNTFNIHLLTDFTLMSAICAPLIWFARLHFVSHPQNDESQDRSTSVWQWPHKSLWAIGIIAFCCMLGEGAMSDWTSLYMKNVAHSSNNMAPLALLSFSICMMIGRLLGDGYRLQWGDNNLLVGGSIFAILGALLTIGLLHPIAVIIGTALIGLGLSTIVPIAYSFAGNAPGLQPGVGISMVTTIGYSGFIFGPAIIGFIAEWAGLRIGFTFLTGLFILMMLLCLQRAKSNV